MQILSNEVSNALGVLADSVSETFSGAIEITLSDQEQMVLHRRRFLQRATIAANKVMTNHFGAEHINGDDLSESDFVAIPYCYTMQSATKLATDAAIQSYVAQLAQLAAPTAE